MLLRWLDRYETYTYEIRDQGLRLWLPAGVSDGILAIEPESDTLLTLTLAGGTQADQPAVAAFLRDWWDLDRDLGPFYAQFQEDPLLAASLRSNYGARVVGFPDLFEALTIGILGQQVNVQFAYTLKGRLTAACGHHREDPEDGHRRWRFPQPADLAGVTVDDLRDMQISRRKAEYLLGVAEEMAAGKLQRGTLLPLSLEVQTQRLTQLRGIGPWTAHYVALKCLHQQRAFPAGDAGLQNNVKRLLGLERKPSVEELQTLARPWAGWETYATWFLWMA